MLGITGNKLHGFFITETRPGNQGVIYVRTNAISFIEYRSDATLRIKGRAFIERPLLRTVTLQWSASRNAKDRPAAPLPMIKTSLTNSDEGCITYDVCRRRVKFMLA